MKRVGAGLVAVVVALLVVPSAPAGTPQIDVSAGTDLNIHAQSGTPMGVQILYLAGPEEWQVIGNFVVAGSGCEQTSSAEVRCAEDDEDVDVEFSDSGGSITMATADSFLDFDTDIQLGDGSDDVDASDGIDIVHHDGSPGSTTSGDDIDTLDGPDQITTGDGSDIIDGGDGADTIVTNDGFNFVNGGEAAGDDSGDGDDDITGGPDQDTIDGGMGDDTIDAGDGNDVIDGSLDDDDIDAGPGPDGTGGGTNHLRGGDGNDTIDGGDGTDLIEGGDDTDTLNGDNQNDTLDGGPGTDTLNGGANDDVLLNSDGPDTFNGNANGTTGDEVDYDPTAAAAMTIDIDNVADDGRNCPGGSCENDNVTTTVENVTGDSSADRITGSSAANVLDGAGGDDTLAGGAGTGGDGADRFIGSTGSGDLVTYESRTGAITADIDGIADDAGEGDDVETDVEDLTGGSGSDNLTGSASVNELRGGPGTGNDTLTGGAESDLLFGGTGTNAALDGADVFNGGTNTATGDTVSYAGRTGAITADLDGAADDGAAGENDDVNADVENLTGGSAADDLTGNAQDNTINGGGSNDDLAGGTGAADDGSDTFTGGTGSDDEVSYASRTADLDVDIDGVADDGLTGELDNVETTVENLVGGSGDDDLTGNNAANELAGNGGDDDLAGGTGTGPDGADTLNGGTHGTPGGQGGDFGDLADYATRTDDLDIDLGGGNDGAGGCPAGAGCEDDDVQATMDRITAGDGDDVLIGNAEDNILIADEGDDVLRGGAGTGPDGADSLSGGSLGETNGDTVSYANRTDAIVASAQIGSSGGGGCPSAPGCEDDSINSSVEHITGGAGTDTLSGTSANNRLSGGAGDDVLAGSLGTGPDGADTFIGGPQGAAGDTVTYATAFGVRADDVTADIGGGADDVDGDNISSDIDNLTGGDGDDTLFGDSDPNRLDGGVGDDVLAGGQAVGPDGADVLIGGDHGTVGGQHTALRDLVTYFSRTDDITANLATGVGGAAGENDIIDASVERATGGAGDDTLTGDAEANRLEGGNGDDLLAGGVSAGPDDRDIFVGGGNTAAGDTVSYAARTDVIAAVTASGPANGGGGCPSALTCEDDEIQATVENLTGGSNDDTLTGDADPNTLTGGDGEDTMSALGGSDRVEARDGFADAVDCGTESDTAVLDEGTLDTQVLCETLDQPPLQPPETTILSGPDNPTNRRRATFTFEADEPATFACKLDNRQSRPCTSPKTFRNLTVGRHKVRIVATDLVGQVDPTAAVYRWRIR